MRNDGTCNALDAMRKKGMYGGATGWGAMVALRGEVERTGIVVQARGTSIPAEWTY